MKRSCMRFAALFLFGAVALPPPVHAQQFICPGGLESFGSLGTGIGIEGGGNVVLSAEGGCRSQGGEPVAEFLTASYGVTTPSTSTVTVTGITASAFYLTAPTAATVRFRLAPIGGGTPIHGAPFNFTFPWSATRTIPDVPPGTYLVSLTAVTPDQLVINQPTNVQVVVEDEAPPLEGNFPSHWWVTEQSYDSFFPAPFNNTNGVWTPIPIDTHFDSTSPSQTRNEVRSFSFTIGQAGRPKYGRMRGMTTTVGGTPYYWLSAAPADLSWVGYQEGQSSTWNGKCASYGTGSFYWMEQGATLPSGVPPAANRCVLQPNVTYYFNVVFYNIRNLVTQQAQTNTCVRPATNPPPATWECHAGMQGDSTQGSENPGE